jgi:hypothetical protein
MPGITYTIRFHRRDRRGCIPEEQEYTVLADAWESFRLFAEPDSAEMYTRIELVSFDWEAREEHPIASMDFAEPYSY